VNLVSRSRIKNRNRPRSSPSCMRRLRACCVTHSPTGCEVAPSTWTRRVATSITNSTYSRCNKTVSTVKKSTANTPVAWARKNCRQVSADRAGAGATPARRRIAHTVLVPIRSLYPSRHNSPWMRRYPRSGSPWPAAAPAREARPPPADGHAGGGRSSGVGPGPDASGARLWAGRASPARPAEAAAARAQPALPGRPSQRVARPRGGGAPRPRGAA